MTWKGILKQSKEINVAFYNSDKKFVKHKIPMNKFDDIVSSILKEVTVTSQQPTFPKGSYAQDVSDSVPSRDTRRALKRKRKKLEKDTDGGIVPSNHHMDIQRGS